MVERRSPKPKAEGSTPSTPAKIMENPLNVSEKELNRLQRHFGELRTVWSVAPLFTQGKIEPVLCCSESVGEDGKPDWQTLRMLRDKKGFVSGYLRPQMYFFKKQDALDFARKALYCFSVYSQAQLDGHRRWIEKQSLVENRIDSFVEELLTS